MTGFLLCVESQISELTEKLIILKSRLNQNSRSSIKPSFTDFLLKKPNPKSYRKKNAKNLGDQEVHPELLLK